MEEKSRCKSCPCVSHFPNHYDLTRKDLTVKNIKRYRKELERLYEECVACGRAPCTAQPCSMHRSPRASRDRLPCALLAGRFGRPPSARLLLTSYTCNNRSQPTRSTWTASCMWMRLRWFRRISTNRRACLRAASVRLRCSPPTVANTTRYWPASIGDAASWRPLSLKASYPRRRVTLVWPRPIVPSRAPRRPLQHVHRRDVLQISTLAAVPAE